MDYTAGASRGPHHQPTPFEDDKNSEWPALPTKPLVWKEDKPKNKPQGHKCFYCGQNGHWNLQCPTPHNKCHGENKCVVPRRHLYFEEACHYGGRTAANNPDPSTQYPHRRKRQTTTADFTPPPVPNSTPVNNSPNNGLPPTDSLLFSPNPTNSQLDPLAQSFLPSRYQGQAPPPGTWGNAPWGTGWGEAACDPRLPYLRVREGRVGAPVPREPESRTASTHTDTTTIQESSQGQNSTVPAATDDLPYDFGVEDLSQYDERDLPGATYDYEDDPFAPTAAKVVEYRQRLLRDLGVSI